MAEIDDIDPRELSREEFARLLGSVREDAAESRRADVADMDPQVFARLIKRASSDQIGGVMGDPALRRPVLEEIFRRMADRFRTDKAPRKDSAIHWWITGGPDGDDRYETWIAGGEVATSSELTHEPRTTLSMSGEQFLKLVSGNGSPTTMFMTGKLKLEGDIGFAANLTNMFDIPKA